MASEMIAKTYRRIFWKTGPMAMKLVPNVYIVGAHALETDNVTRTARNLPKPSIGERTADMRLLILSPFSNPVVQDGTAGAVLESKIDIA
jgi:hypothetical protein